MKVKISKYNYKKCVDFANKQLKTSADLYAYRGEAKKEKMVYDIIVGKLAELGVTKYLKCSKPDFTIYERKKKSYSADLRLGNLRVHVKGQSEESVARYGHSWLFQRTDGIVRKATPYDVIVLTEVSVRKLEVRILKLIRAREITKWGECKVPSYRHSKVALYLKEMEDGYDH
tara:strand:+ start:3494 stop:4012 length:519 start_codon:yes stop_codon:yes gene_type:complete